MSLYPRDKAIIALSDGTVEHGYAIGKKGTTGGELCFNTSMTGYQEIFTDPSYYGQLMMMTYPHIGNYGTMSRDDEARQVMISGLIVRSFSWEFSNPMADGSLQEYLERNEVIGISGVDTRRLVRHIRTKGVMNAVISSEELDEEKLVQKAKNWPQMKGLELASEVTRQEPQTVHSEGPYKVAAFDYGIKQNIINNLVNRGCTLRIFPAKGDFLEEIKTWEPDGFFFSNGPGDPNATSQYALDVVRYAKESQKPCFGICLGHQLMALEEGIPVKKMYVGHRGANQPVLNKETGNVEITTQNHGFAVDEEALDESKVEVTHVNLNDDSIEGLRFKSYPGFSVQYHPEASPGPHDSSYLFDHFLDLIKEGKEELV
ncbi:glutamine-hydrolyzing carbamoyl-phosphate synthase small subunit [Aliifodinibius sp. S!AR15-10]|uniref:glutamine-hydrolyzing carbamoyl-phosphate synthase small subunit n=1 Tax=Aliifodinibius sp. S!AR15-10 TaxID=2950437 RepID=UPI002855F528|nr:glutamine-hydrolyzing carbamoyl-phosphate synthase small subunit [Aliifodinibius sp. S!AR15-10]MDR8392466.1 glutamine-hydrolyzing carbamoyl-phosphate synthase small subunit [Aliifodinibius sp. S!AR15-10]